MIQLSVRRNEEILYLQDEIALVLLCTQTEKSEICAFFFLFFLSFCGNRHVLQKPLWRKATAKPPPEASRVSDQQELPCTPFRAKLGGPYPRSIGSLVEAANVNIIY